MKKVWLTSKTKGFSLVEVILSSAVFVLLVTALVGAYLYGQESTMLAGNRARANMLAEEGLEAVHNIRDADFTNLTDGTFGLTTTGNQWNLFGASDTTDIFTRNVVISTVDANTKNVTSNVTWQQNPQRSGSVSLSTELTNWQRLLCADEASLLAVNVTGASLVAGARNLVGITVQNTGTGCGDILIDKVRVSWVPLAGNRRIQNVLIGNISVWAGNSPSGTLLDINNTTLIEGPLISSTEYRFNASMAGRTFTLVFTMGDGSTKTVGPIGPL